LLLVATTVFALMAYRITQRRLEEEQRQRTANQNQLLARIEKEWDEPERRYVRLEAEELGILFGYAITRDVNETEIVLGMQLSAVDPQALRLRITTGYPALAHYLRTNLAPRSVLCHVHIYKNSSDAMEALLRGQVDIMQLSPAPYVEARRRGAAITPLVAQTHGGQAELRAAIFVHTNSGLDRLEALRGRTFAFADWDSAIGHHLPKVELLAVGLRARDLIRWTNARPWHVIRFVRQGQFAAGPAERALGGGEPHCGRSATAGAPPSTQPQHAVGGHDQDQP
jgi:hypothetical protein